MKLTNEMRQTVIVLCLAATFKRREAKYDKSRVAFADALYELAYGEAEKIAKKLPKNWFAKHRCVTIKADGFRHIYSSKNVMEEMPSDSFFTSKDRFFPNVPLIDFLHIVKGHALYEQLEEIRNEFQAIVKAKTELRNKLTELLYSVNTLAKLKETWPEGEKYFPKETERKTAVVPFNIVSAINHLMTIHDGARYDKTA